MKAATQHLGTPQRHGAGWFVPSGQVGYYVEKLQGQGRWRCTCPSARWRRQQLCKHVQAVIRALREEVAMGD
jgi:uncharacterized Zn finger protein